MTTTLSDLDRPQPDEVDVKARPISRRSTGADAIFANSARVVGASVLVITGGVGLFLGYQAIPTFKRYGFGFFTEQQWSPDTDTIGIAAVLVGTFQVALVALVIAFPLALATALYISEYAPAKLKATLVSMVDLMAAVPSVIYGLFVALLIMPHAADLSIWFDRNFGWLPIFDVPGGEADAPHPGPDPVRLQRLRRRHRGVDDGDADGLRRDASGVLADAAGGEGGCARARCLHLGHGPHRRAALRPRRHHRRHDARDWAVRSARPSPSC